MQCPSAGAPTSAHMPRAAAYPIYSVEMEGGVLSVCTLHMVCLHFQLTVHLTADFGVGGVRMGKMATVTRFSLLNGVNPGPHYHGSGRSPQLSSCQLRDPPGTMTHGQSIHFSPRFWTLRTVAKLESRETQGRCAAALFLV